MFRSIPPKRHVLSISSQSYESELKVHIFYEKTNYLVAFFSFVVRSSVSIKSLGSLFFLFLTFYIVNSQFKIPVLFQPSSFAYCSNRPCVSKNYSVSALVMAIQIKVHDQDRFLRKVIIYSCLFEYSDRPIA